MYAGRIVAKMGELLATGEEPEMANGTPSLTQIEIPLRGRGVEHDNTRERGVYLAYKAMLLNRTPDPEREERWNYHLSRNGIVHYETYGADLTMATPSLLRKTTIVSPLLLLGGSPLYRARGLRYARRVHQDYLRFEDSRRGVE